jgi:hypothetical protein
MTCWRRPRFEESMSGRMGCGGGGVEVVDYRGNRVLIFL